MQLWYCKCFDECFIFIHKMDYVCLGTCTSHSCPQSVCVLEMAGKGGEGAAGSWLFPCLSATELNATSFPIPRSAATNRTGRLWGLGSLRGEMKSEERSGREGGGKRGGEGEKEKGLTLEKMERRDGDGEDWGEAGWWNYKEKMINIRNVTMKPSGRREGQEGGKWGRKETKGNKEQTKGRYKKEMGG